MTSVSETMAIAVQQHQAGRLDEAIALYRQVLTFNDANVVAYSNLGAALQQQGRLEEAADCYHRALAIATDLVEAIGNLGTVFKLQEFRLLNVSSKLKQAERRLEAIQIKIKVKSRQK